MSSIDIKIESAEISYLSSTLFYKKTVNGYIFWPSIFQSWESRTKLWFSSASGTSLLIKQQSQKREGEWLNKFSIFLRKKINRSFGQAPSTIPSVFFRLCCYTGILKINLKNYFHFSFTFLIPLCWTFLFNLSVSAFLLEDLENGSKSKTDMIER